MLYQLHEWQCASLAPWRWLAEATQRVLTHPGVPLSYTHFGRSVSAGCEVLQQTTRRHGRPAFGLAATRIDEQVVAVHDRVVTSQSFCDLRRFEREGTHDDPKVLLVAPLSGHFPTLLRGTVAALLPDHDVYITDWADARDVPLSEGAFDLDDYIDTIIGFLRWLGPDTHIIAVCQPSVPVLAAVAIMAAADDPDQPRSMTLMGGPVDTRRNPTKVNKLATSRPIGWFEKSVIASVPFTYAGRMRRVYPGFLQLTGFMSMNLERHIGAHIRLFQNLVKGDGDSANAHRRFYDEYLSVMDLPAEFYLQTIATVFQTHALPSGTMVSRDRPIELAAIRRTALMTVEGELDDISGIGQTAAAHDLCVNIPAAKRRHRLQPETGHYGIFNGHRWRTTIAPEIGDFIRANA